MLGNSTLVLLSMISTSLSFRSIALVLVPCKFSSEFEAVFNCD